MPGYNPQQVANSARNANTVAVAIGETMLAFGQTTNHSFGMGAEQLYGIGSAKPQEIQQLKLGPTVTLTEFALTEAGEILINGGTTLVSLLANNSFDISVVDGQSGSPLFTYVGCVASSFNESVTANTPIRPKATMMACGFVTNAMNDCMILFSFIYFSPPYYLFSLICRSK